MNQLTGRFKPANAFYAAAVFSMILFPWICALAGDGNLPPQKAFARFWINLIFLVVMAGYAWVFAQRKPGEAVLSKTDWAIFALIGLSFCAIVPVFSNDIHDYLMRGRILGVYHENPYLPPKVYADDPFYKLSFWVATVHLPENYGPAWSVVQWIAPTAFPKSYFLSVFFFKVILFAFLAGSVWLFNRICRLINPENAGWMTAFFALNPILIDHILIDAHNDIVMVFWLLAGFYLFLKNKPLWAVAACAMAVMVKYTSIIFLPVLAIYYLRKKNASFGFGVFAAVKWTVVFAAVCVAMYLPFWVGPETLFYFSQVVNEWFATNSVPYAAWSFLNRLGFHVSQDWVRHAFMAFFLVNALAALAWLGFKRDITVKDACRAVSWIFLAMYLSYAFPLYGHHLLWALPFMILSEFPAPVLWASLYGVTGLFFYFKRPSILIVGGLAVYALYLAAKSLNPRGKKGYNKPLLKEGI